MAKRKKKYDGDAVKAGCFACIDATHLRERLLADLADPKVRFSAKQAARLAPLMARVKAELQKSLAAVEQLNRHLAEVAPEENAPEAAVSEDDPLAIYRALKAQRERMEEAVKSRPGEHPTPAATDAPPDVVDQDETDGGEWTGWRPGDLLTTGVEDPRHPGRCLVRKCDFEVVGSNLVVQAARFQEELKEVLDPRIICSEHDAKTLICSLTSISNRLRRLKKAVSAQQAYLRDVIEAAGPRSQPDAGSSPAASDLPGAENRQPYRVDLSDVDESVPLEPLPGSMMFASAYDPECPTITIIQHGMTANDEEGWFSSELTVEMAKCQSAVLSDFIQRVSAV